MSEAPLLLIAMKEEATAFPKAVREGARSYLEVGGVRHEVVFSGPGQLSVREELAGREPASILNVGFAGALKPEHKVGDLFRVTSARWAADVVAIDDDSAFAFLPELPPARIVTAPLPQGVREKKIMNGHDAGELVDMETYHVLSFCREQGIPYAGVRVVSDELEHGLPEVVELAWNGRGFRLKPIIKAFIKSHGARMQILRLRRHARLASEALAARLF